MKRLWLIFTVWLTVLLSVFFPVSSSAAPDISMNAEVGYDGTYLQRNWTPVRTVLKNSGSDFEGNLEITVKAGQDGNVVYSTPVNLPNTSEKEYTIYAKIYEAQRDLNINLTDGNGRIIKSIKAESLYPVGENKYLLGLITNDQPSLGYWKEKLAGSQLFSNYQPVSLDISNFPDHREALSAFSVLVFNNIDTSAFRPEQLRAMKEWIQDGGILITGAGVNGKKTLGGLTGNILQVTTGEIKELKSVTMLEDLTGQQMPEGTTLQIMNINTQEGKVLLSDDENKLVWMFPKRKGTIFISAFDLGTEPILSWAGNRILWEKLLTQNLDSGSLNSLRNPIQKSQARTGLTDVLGNIEAMEMPSAMLILFLFLFYLALVGPVNYIFLKKIDKREWSWVTIPAISIIFAGLIFGLGYNTKGGELIVNTISVVDLNSNEDQGSLTNYMGIFIPRRGDYEVEIDRYALLSSGDIRYDGSQGSLSNAVLARMVQGKPSRIFFDNANIWTMKTFKTDPVLVELGSINSDLYYEMGKIKGSVVNNTIYPLENLVIYTPSAFVEVGNIAAGEVKNVELALPFTGRTRYNDNIYNMIDSIFPWSHGQASDQQSRQDMTRREILNNLIWPVYDVTFPTSYKLQSYLDGEKSPALELSYFAFYQGQQEEGITVNGKKPDRTMCDGIILGNMDLTVEKEGIVSIPPGMVFAEYEKDMSSFAEINGDYFYIQQPSGYAVFSIDLSPYMNLQDLQVMIGVDLYYANGKAQIFDVEAGDYTDVDGNTISLDKSNLSKYVDSENKVWLKLLPNGQDVYIEMGVPTITLEGMLP